MAPYTHVVVFDPKPETTPEQIKKICEEAAALKDNCVRPETKEPYFKSFTLGKGNTQNVLKGSEGDQQIIAVMEFANEEDREYYLTKDPVHLGFVQWVAPFLTNAQVLRFIPGDF